ncbi:AAA family ATPase [Heyndrickxia ginsengihumi]|uniref:AAA family ATPase n=1 Tax=Heyndrickxia ginsengihumi TaxID=363870 RepID=UPI00203B35DC|nr:SMC family ATPase [Heyndrickxia ginsengihumi]MCM3024413.1 SMC family ATPase [Heyndrickxia ginsengihumi]
MIINKLILQDFRAFKGYHEFDFTDKKIVVIDGPNGHGKSTIFDAINWVLLGKLNRYTGSIEHKRFNYIVNYHAKLHGLYTTFVQVILMDDNGKSISIKREIKYNSPEKVYIDGEAIAYNEISRKIAKVLVGNKNIDIAEEENDVDLAALVSSTQILSQEDLDEFVRGNKPGERYKKLEKILGFKKYGEDFKGFLNTTKSVVNKLLQELKEKEQKVVNKKNIIEARYAEKKQLYENSGGITEDQLLEKIYDIDNKNNVINITKGIELSSIKKINDLTLEKLNNSKDSFYIMMKSVEDIRSELKAKGLTSATANLNDLILKRKLLNKKIQVHKNKINEKEILINRAKERISKLGEIEIKRNRINQNNLEIDKLEKELRELVTSIEYLSNNSDVEAVQEKETFEEFQKKYINRKNQLDDLNIWLKINKNDQTILNLQSNMNEIDKLVEQDIRVLETILHEKINYEKKIDEISRTIEYEEDSQLNQFIYDIQNHILNSDHSSDCPVCGTDFTNLNKSLKEQVKEKLNKSKKELDELQQSKLQLVNSFNELESKSISLTNNIKKNEEKIQSIKQQIGQLNTKNINFKSEIREYHTNDGFNNNQRNIEIISSFLKDYENIFTNISIIINKKNQINILEQRLTHKKNERKNNFNSIPSRYSIYIESITGISNKIQMFNNYIDLIVEENKNTKKDLDNLILEYDNCKRKEADIVGLSQKYQNEFCDSYCILDIGTILTSIEDRYTGIKILIQDIEKVIYAIYSYLNESEFTKLISEKEKITFELDELNKSIEKNSMILEQVEEFLKGHKSVQTSLLNQYLEEQSKNINFYFKQISPHAFYKNVKLVAAKGELYILLMEDGYEIPNFEIEDLRNEVNASLTFSAAQSTILALSIFLSLNLSHNWSDLEILGIDDPFQNLDDVNIYSFVDVISTLINQKRKQVFLSTHNNDFSKLISSKLDINEHEIGNISFLSYSKDKMLISSNVHFYEEK